MANSPTIGSDVDLPVQVYAFFRLVGHEYFEYRQPSARREAGAAPIGQPQFPQKHSPENMWVYFPDL